MCSIVLHKVIINSFVPYIVKMRVNRFPHRVVGETKYPVGSREAKLLNYIIIPVKVLCNFHSNISHPKVKSKEMTTVPQRLVILRKV